MTVPSGSAPIDTDLVRALWLRSLPEPRLPELPAELLEDDRRWVPWDEDAPCEPDCACWDFDGDGPCTPEWDQIAATLRAAEQALAEQALAEQALAEQAGAEQAGAVPAVEVDEPGWAVPGVTWDDEPAPATLPGVSPVMARLLAAAQELLAVDPAALPDAQVLVDAEALQGVLGQLRVTQLGWTAQVQARELHRLRGLRTMKGWLEECAPDAIPADRTLASRLEDLPLLAQAVTARQVSLAAATQVAKACGTVARYLDRPDGLVDGQPGEPVISQILDNTIDLVCQAKGGLAEDDPLLTQLQTQVAELAEVAEVDVAGRGGSMLARVCGAFTLLARHLGAGTTLQGALDQQVEAVLPNLLEQKETTAEQRRGVGVRKLRNGAWRLEGTLTPEVGEQLLVALATEARRDPGNPLDTMARAHARAQAVEAAGGDAFTDTPAPEDLPRWEQDALRDLTGMPGPGHPEHDEHATDLAHLLPPSESQTTSETRRETTGETPTGTGGTPAGTTGEQPTDALSGLTADELALLVPRTPSRRLHDALGRLLERYLSTGLGGTVDKVPVQLTATVTTALVEGKPGALPARSARTGQPFARSLLRRWWGDAHITTLVLSHGWQPLGEAHSGRTLKGRERRALNVQWDYRCAGTDCCPPTPQPLRTLVPHHVKRYSRNGGVTSLTETIPCCPTLHHDIHLGKRTIRLRDGRLINEDGYLEDG